MAKKWSPKDPQERRDYGRNWIKQANGTDKSIVGSTWTVVTGDVTIVTDSFTATNTTVRLAGGTVGVKNSLLNHVTLDNGEEWERTCTLEIKSL